MTFAQPEDFIGHLNFSPGAVVADFGAGSGHIALILARRLKDGGGKVYAFDIQEPLLLRLKKEARAKKLDNLEIIWSDLEAPGGSLLKDQTCDAIVISNLLFQVQKRDNLLREAFRICRQGGKILIIDWRDSYGHLGPLPEKVVSREETRRMAEKAGFVFEEEFAAGEHHYGLLFNRGKMDNENLSQL